MTSIDVSAARAIESIAVDAKEAGKSVYVAGMSEFVKSKLIGLDVYKALTEGNIFANRGDAVKAAVAKVA